MNLETAVCILATVVCLVSFLTIALCYGVNQLSVKNLNAAEQLRQTSLMNITVAEKFIELTERARNEQQRQV